MSEQEREFEEFDEDLLNFRRPLPPDNDAAWAEIDRLAEEDRQAAKK